MIDDPVFSPSPAEQEAIEAAMEAAMGDGSASQLDLILSPAAAFEAGWLAAREYTATPEPTEALSETDEVIQELARELAEARAEANEAEARAATPEAVEPTDELREALSLLWQAEAALEPDHGEPAYDSVIHRMREFRARAASASGGTDRTNTEEER